MSGTYWVQGGIWYGMVWYGNRIIFIAKVLKKQYTKTKMQRFSNTIIKILSQKRKQIVVYLLYSIYTTIFTKTIHKNKDAKVLKYHYKNTLTKKKTNRILYIQFIRYIENDFTKKSIT
jgi:hypothetical protein